MLFGHDWRADGVMRIVASLAETKFSPLNFDEQSPDNLPRMFNLIPSERSEISKFAIQASEESRGLLEVGSLHSFCGDRQDEHKSIHRYIDLDHPLRETRSRELHDNPVAQFWLLRHVLTKISANGVRVCLGGKTQNYKGRFSGIAEEAFFACRDNMPLYLVGGFGGATSEVAACFSQDPGSLFRDLNNGSPLKNHTKIKNGLTEHLSLTWKIPETDLSESFMEYGLENLGKCNGLNAYQNEELFRATDLEVVFHLMDVGLNNLVRDERITPAHSSQ
ncbi:MAG: hypothetical protein AAF572_29035 [Cyanobacteria bacterium P01_B01_bin.77]